jgi:hypothetical protein
VSRRGSIGKTARRYVEAACAAGLVREGGVGQLDDALIGAVVEAVRPVRPPPGAGPSWPATSPAARQSRR